MINNSQSSVDDPAAGQQSAAPAPSECTLACGREDWFPTSVWLFDLEPHDALNEQLRSCILDERRRDPQGMTDRSVVLGWHSTDQLHLRPELASLLRLIKRNVLEVVQFLKWDLAKVAPVLLNCWANVNEKFASNVVHNHAGSLLSGVYYVQTAPRCGKISFRDPRDGAAMDDTPHTELTRWTYKKVDYQPRAGRMLIFPSWLYHGVGPNLEDEPRICLSFNITARSITRT